VSAAPPQQQPQPRRFRGSLDAAHAGRSLGIAAPLTADTSGAGCIGNWTGGKPVIISPTLSNEDTKQRLPGGWKELKPYLRVVDQPPLPR
jgi:hypothetical protein